MSKADVIKEEISKLEKVVEELDELDNKAITPIVENLSEQLVQLKRIYRRIEAEEQKHG